MQTRTYYACILVLSVLALFSTVYLMYQHYVPEQEGSFCDVGGFDCRSVNTSYFSTVFSALYLDVVPVMIGFDIPFALLGFLTYLVVFFFGIFGIMRTSFSVVRIPMGIFVLTLMGVLFSVYLTVIEAFVLQAWCLFCVLQALLVMGMFLLTVSYMREKQRTVL